MSKKGLIPGGLPRNNKSLFGSIPRTLGSRLLIFAQIYGFSNSNAMTDRIRWPLRHLCVLW
ncbi:MAG: hypothetical protein CR994_04515 [Maribacter sp.]|nr:MAG: hypothetical protein CR994_04515 [Maribacter sp.]